MEHPINTVIITQARTGSTRLPNKVLMKINDTELLKIHIDRLSKSRLKDKLIVATTISNNDKKIIDCCNKWNVSWFSGSEDDVLDRFYQACKDIKPEWVVRVTSDCPLIDSTIIDGVIAMAKVNNLDYCSNVLIEDFPDGQDVEVFKFKVLEKAWRNATLKSDREHVTPYIRRNSSCNHGELFKSMNFPCFSNYNSIRMTVDEPKDFELIQTLISTLGVNQTWLTYVNHIIENNLNNINSKIFRNEGYFKSLKND